MTKTYKIIASAYIWNEVKEYLIKQNIEHRVHPVYLLETHLETAQFYTNATREQALLIGLKFQVEIEKLPENPS